MGNFVSSSLTLHSKQSEFVHGMRKFVYLPAAWGLGVTNTGVLTTVSGWADENAVRVISICGAGALAEHLGHGLQRSPLPRHSSALERKARRGRGKG